MVRFEAGHDSQAAKRRRKQLNKRMTGSPSARLKMTRTTGGWTVADGRFMLGRDQRGWWILSNSDSTVSDWLAAQRLSHRSFQRLKDARDALHAHLTVSPLPTLEVTPVRWRPPDDDGSRASHCGRFRVTRSYYRGWYLRDLTSRAMFKERHCESLADAAYRAAAAHRDLV